MVEDWITTQEAAILSGYHPNYIRKLIRAGEIHGRKWGQSWQISRTSLLAYLESAKQSEDKRWGPK